MSRRAAIVGVALGLFVIAGGATALVQVVTFPRLLTGIPSALGSAGEDSCFTSWAEGTLVPDLASGTAITITDHGVRTVVPVMWRPGFTARRVGLEVEVLDREGQVVATTGHTYRLEGGGADGAFWACGAVTSVTAEQ